MKLLVGTLHEGEHLSRTVRIVVEPELRTKTIRIAFLTPDKKRKLSPPIPLTNGVGDYYLPSILLSAKGELIMQGQAYSTADAGASFIAKSNVIVKEIYQSVPIDGEDPSVNDLITLAEVDDRVRELEQNYADFATEQYVIDAVSAAIADVDAALAAMDEVIGGETE